MPNIISYFNPFSSQHHALDNFSSMSTPKKFLTIIATCLTLPLGIVGGIATFRALTNRFAVIGPTYRSPQVTQVDEQAKQILCSPKQINNRSSKPTTTNSTNNRDAKVASPSTFQNTTDIATIREKMENARNFNAIKACVQQLEELNAPFTIDQVDKRGISPKLALVLLEKATSQSEIDAIFNKVQETIDAENLSNDFNFTEDDGFGLPGGAAPNIDPKKFLMDALNRVRMPDSKRIGLRQKIENYKPAQVTSPPKSTPEPSVTSTTKNRPVASPIPSNLSMAEVKRKLETTDNIPELKRYLRLLDEPFTLAHLPNRLLSPQLALILLEEGSCPESTIYAIIDQVLRTMEAEDISRSFLMDENDGFGERTPVMPKLDPKELLHKALDRETSYSEAQKAIIRANISRYNSP